MMAERLTQFHRHTWRVLGLPSMVIAALWLGLWACWPNSGRLAAFPRVAGHTRFSVFFDDNRISVRPFFLPELHVLLPVGDADMFPAMVIPSPPRLKPRFLEQQETFAISAVSPVYAHVQPDLATLAAWRPAEYAGMLSSSRPQPAPFPALPAVRVRLDPALRQAVLAMPDFTVLREQFPDGGRLTAWIELSAAGTIDQWMWVGGDASADFQRAVGKLILQMRGSPSGGVVQGRMDLVVEATAVE